jgi:bifunctional non-homologous end joining protein LigD
MGLVEKGKKKQQTVRTKRAASAVRSADPLPTLSPMLASERFEPFDSPEFIYELKWDGYRCIAHCNIAEVKLISRNGASYNNAFIPVVKELQKHSYNAVLDGEIVVLDENGIPQIKLIELFQSSGKGKIEFHVFDILFLNGKDLTKVPLIKRKQILRKILVNNEVVKYCDHFTENGAEFFSLVKEQGLEGIVAKKKESLYYPGERSKEWIKITVRRVMDAIVVGYTLPERAKYFGSLILGRYVNNELKYLGHSGGLIGDKEKREIYSRLQEIIRKRSPLKEYPDYISKQKLEWVAPELICEVKYREITTTGKLRLPVFQRMRYDISPVELKKNSLTADQKEIKSKPGGEELKIDLSANDGIISEGSKSLKLSNLNKQYFPDDHITKRDIIEYYLKVADYILPYLKDRPTVLNRHINGINGPNVFHQSLTGLKKNYKAELPEWLETVDVFTKSYSRNVPYLICQDKLHLAFMVQLGCIEINPWHSRRSSLEYPDYIVIDLDPEEVDFQAVKEVAMAGKEVLDKAGINGYLKTSGATGLHIYVPVGGNYHVNDTQAFAELLCSYIHHSVPKITSLERMPIKRKGKVYVDFLQNGWTKTIAAVYGVRPKKGATIATPLEWLELNTDFEPGDFNIHTILDRIKEKGDLFKPLITGSLDMNLVLSRLNNM